jgi:hypothetical protein
VQTAEHVAAAPVSVSVVQTSPSSQEVGQLLSQVSPLSMTPLPQVGEQSPSVLAEHPAGQQPSPSWHWVMLW